MDLQLQNKTAVVTGAGGAICGAIAVALAEEGANVGIWDLDKQAAEAKAETIRRNNGKALAVACDVMDRESVAQATQYTVEEFGTVDILINGAGGAYKKATTSPDNTFFDLKSEDIAHGLHMNYLSAVVPSQVVGKIFAEKKEGAILNITSVAGISPITRAISYANGKAAATNFTKWLAIHMVQNYSPNIRVNAIAPGFIITKQNYFLLIDENTEGLTERGKTILERVPIKRFGKPEEIVGLALLLVSEKSSFITGSVMTIDGGLTAYPGV